MDSRTYSWLSPWVGYSGPPRFMPPPAVAELPMMTHHLNCDHCAKGWLIGSTQFSPNARMKPQQWSRQADYVLTDHPRLFNAYMNATMRSWWPEEAAEVLADAT